MGYWTVITYTLKDESVASLKAVGGRVVCEVQPKEWSILAAPAKSQPVYDQAK